MSVRDPNTNKYVSTDRDAVKRGDQNTAAIGPARLSAEEESQQQFDKGLSSAVISNVTVGGTDPALGMLAPTYYHTSEYFGVGTYAPIYGGTYGFLYPVLVGQASVIDGLAVHVVDGTTISTYHAYYVTRLGIYSELNGMPYTLLAETAEFNWGDGSIANNTLHVESIGPLVLPAGRYWLGLKKQANAPDAGCSLFGRLMRSNAGPFTQTMIVADQAGYGWEVPWPEGLSTPTNFPSPFDFNGMKTGFSEPFGSNAMPEIFMRAA